jgi:hypothetical protein
MQLSDCAGTVSMALIDLMTANRAEIHCDWLVGSAPAWECFSIYFTHNYKQQYHMPESFTSPQFQSTEFVIATML